MKALRLLCSTLAIALVFALPAAATLDAQSPAQSDSDVTAIRAGFATAFKDFPDTRYVRTAESVEVAKPGARAFETGTWVGTWTTPAGPLRTGGRYSAYWMKIAGSWKIHSELFVTLFCEGADCR